MSDNAQEDQRQFQLQRIYMKDMSFEAPGAPGIFSQEWKPQLGVNLNTSINEVSENTVEVVLTVTVNAKHGENTAFLVEVQQAGLFHVANIPEQEKDPLYNVFCANILFPYAREAVSDLITRGSFPQLLLAPVNFEALYAQRVQQKQQAQTEAGDQTVN